MSEYLKQKQTFRVRKLMVLQEDTWGKGGFRRLVLTYIYTHILEIQNQQRPTVGHSDPQSILCINLYMKIDNFS